MLPERHAIRSLKAVTVRAQKSVGCVAAPFWKRLREARCGRSVRRSWGALARVVPHPPHGRRPGLNDLFSAAPISTRSAQQPTGRRAAAACWRLLHTPWSRASTTRQRSPRNAFPTAASASGGRCLSAVVDAFSPPPQQPGEWCGEAATRRPRRPWRGPQRVHPIHHTASSRSAAWLGWWMAAAAVWWGTEGLLVAALGAAVVEGCWPVTDKRPVGRARSQREAAAAVVGRWAWALGWVCVDGGRYAAGR